MKARLKKRFDKIMKQRAEYSSHVTLSHKKIYIIPSKLSVMLIVVIALMVLAGINYQNNVFYIFAFWLLSIFIWNFILTFFNLAKLEVIAKNTNNVFAGEPAEFEFELLHKKKDIHGLQIKSDSQIIDSAHVKKNEGKSYFVSHLSKERGKLTLPRLTFSTVYPFGFAYGFSYVYLDLHAWIYPVPIDANARSAEQSKGDQDALDDTQIVGSEDFNRLKEYQPGERLGHIHWANYAKTGELKVKEFVDVNSASIWIDWLDFPMLEQEVRLSHLCFLIKTAHDNNLNFGLRLPNVEMEPEYQSEKKVQHLNQCLLELAKF